MSGFGPAALFMVNTWAAGLLGAFALYRMFRRAPKPKAEQRPIIVSPGGQFTSGQLYSSLRDQAEREPPADRPRSVWTRWARRRRR